LRLAFSATPRSIQTTKDLDFFVQVISKEVAEKLTEAVVQKKLDELRDGVGRRLERLLERGGERESSQE
jgi:hypothetical protein